MDIIDIRCEVVDWSGLAYHRKMLRAVVNAVLNLGFYKILVIS
jgi:hypothetical protein